MNNYSSIFCLSLNFFEDLSLALCLIWLPWIQNSNPCSVKLKTLPPLGMAEGEVKGQTLPIATLFSLLLNLLSELISLKVFNVSCNTIPFRPT